MGLFTKLFGTRSEREVKKLEPQVEAVMALEEPYKKLTDQELRAKTQEFKDRYASGETLDALLPEAFAVCREAADRVLGMRPYRVQVVGGIVLHQGRIAEMKTGEGKTLVAILPAYLNALTGEGVDSLKAAIANQVHELREQARQAEASDVQYEHVWELKREARDKRFTVRKLSEGVFRVVGTQVERMVVQCDWENEEAVVFLQHRLKRVGVEEALEKAGAVDGDEIRICGRAFEFESTRTAADLFEELDI